MLFHTIRASHNTIARAARQSCTRLVTSRSFINPTTVRHVDLIQELYIRELRAHKPTVANTNDSEGIVQKFTLPSVPNSLEMNEDIANELKAYAASSVELEGQAETGSSVKEDDWFEEEPDDDDEHAKH